MRRIKKVLIFALPVILSLIISGRVVFADDTISISISSDTASISVLPDIFNTTSQTITVSTTSIAGYTVDLAPSGPSNALINEADSSLTIPTFTLPEGATSLPANSTGYGYGFSTDSGTNYYPVPAPEESSQRIYETSSAGLNEHVLTFGALVPHDTPSGIYSGAIVIQAVAKLEPCPADHICYYGNRDDGTGAMDNQSASSNTNVTLIPSNFSRPGYGFVGWNTAVDGTGTNYGPNQTINPGDITVEGLQLYAKWTPSVGNLQGWTGCGDLEEGEVIALTDERDGNVYAVTKYADNQCWMMENLRLDLSASDLIINGSNTNRPTSSFVQYINDKDNNNPASTNSFCSSNSDACINQILFNTNNTNRSLTPSYNTNNSSSSWYAYGNYYNWYTATAGNGTRGLSTGGAAADGDLCPANWRLPAGYGSVGDLAMLDVAMGGTGANQESGTSAGLTGSSRWRSYPLNFMYSGEQRGNTGYNRGTSSSYATLSAASTERTSNLWLKSDGVYMNSNNTPKYRGQTIRCLFNPGYHVTGTVHYDANGGTGTMADETNVNFATAVAANNGFTKQASSFISWNTSPDGSGVTVNEGGMMAGAADRMGISDGETLTLYAIWKSQYSLIYDKNSNDAVGSMNSVTVSNLEVGKYTLIASNYSLTGYGFAGWSKDPDAGTKLLNGTPVTVYGPNQVVTVDNNFLADADPITNQVTMYAVWLPEDTTYTMQTFGATQCTAMASGSVMALKDSRDNNVYTVAKLEDGNCWMTENLRLLPNTIAFDDTNTNLPTSNFITAAADPNLDSSNTLCNTDDSSCVDTIAFNSNTINRQLNPSHNDNVNSNRSWYSYGVMYNWYTASAGNGDYSMTSGNVVGDICPAGWRLPTGGTGGEFATLNSLANGGNTISSAGLVKFPDNFIYSGDYNNTKPGGHNVYGRFWSATPDGTNNAFRLGVKDGEVTPIKSYGKWDAFAIRCIVKQQTN